MERKCRVCGTIVIVEDNKNISIKSGFKPMCSKCVDFIRMIPEVVKRDNSS